VSIRPLPLDTRLSASNIGQRLLFVRAQGFLPILILIIAGAFFIFTD
jgi:hypothetical protein